MLKMKWEILPPPSFELLPCEIAARNPLYAHKYESDKGENNLEGLGKIWIGSPTTGQQNLSWSLPSLFFTFCSNVPI